MFQDNDNRDCTGVTDNRSWVNIGVFEKNCFRIKLKKKSKKYN